MGQRRLRAGIVGLAVVVLVAGCGSSAAGPASEVPGDNARALPVTTLYEPPSTDGFSFESLVVGEVTEPCPEFEPGAAGGSGAMEETSRLEPMLGQVLAYGSARADRFGTYGLIWHGGGDASVFVSFVGELDKRSPRSLQLSSMGRDRLEDRTQRNTA